MNPMPTWKNTFYSGYRRFGTINQFFLRRVLPSGYPYFEWNGRIYEVVGGDDFEETVYNEQDLR